MDPGTRSYRLKSYGFMYKMDKNRKVKIRRRGREGGGREGEKGREVGRERERQRKNMLDAGWGERHIFISRCCLFNDFFSHAHVLIASP